MAPQQTIAQWLKGEAGPGVQIPWYSGRDVGQAWTDGWGGVCDTQIALLKEATKARFPDYGPSDALPHQAADRGLILSQFEQEANERARIKAAWVDWANVGQPAEFLAQLYWGGFGNAVLVQQNGLAYQLSVAPTAGADPTSLLTITTLPNLVTDQILWPIPQREGLTTSGQTASLSPAGAAATQLIYSKTIPSGNPWWRIDDRTDLCNRFEVLFPHAAPATMIYGIASFTLSTSANVTWNNPGRFQDTEYMTLVGAPVVTTTHIPQVLYEDATKRTALGTTIVADQSWTGTAIVVAFPTGENPFANIGSGDLNALRTLIERWKPACTRCIGIEIVVADGTWGWAPGTWGSGELWGGSTVHYDAE